MYHGPICDLDARLRRRASPAANPRQEHAVETVSELRLAGDRGVVAEVLAKHRTLPGRPAAPALPTRRRRRRLLRVLAAGRSLNCGCCINVRGETSVAQKQLPQ